MGPPRNLAAPVTQGTLAPCVVNVPVGMPTGLRASTIVRSRMFRVRITPRLYLRMGMAVAHVCAMSDTLVPDVISARGGSVEVLALTSALTSTSVVSMARRKWRAQRPFVNARVPKDSRDLDAICVPRGTGLRQRVTKTARVLWRVVMDTPQ